MQICELQRACMQNRSRQYIREWLENEQVCGEKRGKRGIPAFPCDFPISGKWQPHPSEHPCSKPQSLCGLSFPLFHLLPLCRHETDPILMPIFTFIPFSPFSLSLLFSGLHYFQLNHCGNDLVVTLLKSIFHTPGRSSQKFQGLIIASPQWQIVFFQRFDNNSSHSTCPYIVISTFLPSRGEVYVSSLELRGA